MPILGKIHPAFVIVKIYNYRFEFYHQPAAAIQVMIIAFNNCQRKIYALYELHGLCLI